jgi:hypothetical protein
MMDWSTNKPNARFWALKLLKDSFHPGDRMIDTSLNSALALDVEGQGYITSSGRKLLLINKRNRAIEIALPMGGDAAILTVDTQSAEGPARTMAPMNGSVTLQPFAVTVVNWNAS